MGVPLLLTWLKRRFVSCFLASNNAPSVDSLYIDVNGIVYQAAALATATEAAAVDADGIILRRLFELLDDIILHLVRPKSLVYLAVDGISPMGKLAQQRARRRRRRGGGGNNSHAGSRHCSSLEWDSNSISVGTPFMSRLTDALHFYCASRAERINGERLRDHLRHGDTTTAAESPALPITFVVDDVWRPGEGENKIVDAIRRFRSQPSYDPNTSHVICSSDTDVTVCSLILHEPQIYVLRYESQGGGLTSNENSSGSWRNKVGDKWASTFFSIQLFREQLRSILRLQHDKDSVEEVKKKNLQFERALHDVVFVLLLFGNDFLPSLGCRIEDGFLDDLLGLLATDFVSRERSIVDPVTNVIQFEAARYALESLAEMRSERSGGGLSVDNGVEGATDWGFVDEKFLQEKQMEEEREQAPRCYAYWTMLQWSLHNSAGVVDHWGCYYPYSSAPPLHLLRKYCGMLSYEALMELAVKRSRKRVEQGLEAQPSITETKADVRARCAGPTDVLVQLLVLLPARSAALFPSAIRNSYAEIEALVVAPVECIDYTAIEVWCAEKRRLFTTEERTRFSVYALAAGSGVVAGEAQRDHIRGNELLFIADWDSKGFAEEVQAAQALRASEKAKETTACSTAGVPSPAPNTASVFTSPFFSARPGRKASAAVAALLSAPKDRNVPKHVEGSRNDSGDKTNEASVVAVEEEKEEPRRVVEVEAVLGSSFVFFTAPTEALGDATMVTGVGAIVGDTFVCGQHSSAPLSRHPKTMRFRLRWRLASKPLLASATFVPNLLPGYNAPPLLLERENVVTGSLKRGASTLDLPDDDDEEEGQNDLATQGVMAELQKRKEAVRRRLQALQGHAPVVVVEEEEEGLHGKL